MSAFYTRQGLSIYPPTLNTTTTSPTPASPLRFLSFNVPNIHYIEDPPSPYTPPTSFEIEDAFLSIRFLGGKVIRTYCLSIGALHSDLGTLRHVRRFPSGLPETERAKWKEVEGSEGLYLNEELMIALDRVLEVGERLGVGVIVPIIDRWHWWGGIETFSELFGVEGSEFYTNAVVLKNFKALVRSLLTRRNTLTNKLYSETPSVFGWETGNEMETLDGGRCPGSWTLDVAKYIKSLDSNHLILQPDEAASAPPPNPYLKYAPLLPLFLAALLLSISAYLLVQTLLPFISPSLPARLTADLSISLPSQKPLLVGEFGLLPLGTLTPLLEKCSNTAGVLGCLVWSLRFHSRDGGFYTHPEGTTGYFSFHYPGFNNPSLGFPSDSEPMMKTIQSLNANLDPSALLVSTPTPPPLVLPQTLSTVANKVSVPMSIRGSAGAAFYSIYRAFTTFTPMGNATKPKRYYLVKKGVVDAVQPGGVVFTDSVSLGSGFFDALKEMEGRGKVEEVVGGVELVEEGDPMQMFLEGRGGREVGVERGVGVWYVARGWNAVGASGVVEMESAVRI
ncbi:hypothetical protein HDV05_006635 [Chytridiales sp. JEL 0842]|nr:hypothetical protein HDV05_006635 [Chytridiales sp. JEL 0842]